MVETADSKIMSDTPAELHPRCKNLCCKAMLVYGEDFQNDPDYVPGQTDFWCTLTAKGQGPDFVRSHTFTNDGTFPHNTSGGQLSVGQAGAAGGFCWPGE